MSRPAKPKRIYAGDGDPRHGTLHGYAKLKCRCEECMAAHEARATSQGSRGHEDGDRLLAACWCGSANVFVPAAMVRSGQTGSCRYGCTPANMWTAS